MNLKSKVESILFVSNKVLTLGELAKICHGQKNEVEIVISELMNDYNQKDKGINIVKDGIRVQMVTTGDNSQVVEDFIKQELTGEMTQPQLETLTIIAYRGPILKEELEQIRGVNCSLILRNLMIRGLVEVVEDKRSMLTFYQVTMDFIKYLGLNELKELPDYDKLSKSEVLEKLLGEPTNKEEGVGKKPGLKKLDL